MHTKKTFITSHWEVAKNRFMYVNNLVWFVFQGRPSDQIGWNGIKRNEYELKSSQIYVYVWYFGCYLLEYSTRYSITLAIEFFYSLKILQHTHTHSHNLLYNHRLIDELFSSDYLSERLIWFWMISSLEIVLKIDVEYE